MNDLGGMGFPRDAILAKGAVHMDDWRNQRRPSCGEKGEKMTWEENKGRNKLNMWIGGRRQTFPGRRTVVGNNETSLEEFGDVNIKGRGNRTPGIFFQLLLRSPQQKLLWALLITCSALVPQWVEKGVAKWVIYRSCAREVLMQND